MTNLAATAASETVRLNRHYAANPTQIFRAWSDPDALNQWFGPHSHNCSVEEFNFTTGGHYKIRLIPTGAIEDPDCQGDTTLDSVCAGQFVEIDNPHRIVITFNWIKNGTDMGDTLLTIEFFPVDGGTDLILTHERIPDAEVQQAHAGGWQGTLECLESYLARQ